MVAVLCKVLGLESSQTGQFLENVDFKTLSSKVIAIRVEDCSLACQSGAPSGLVVSGDPAVCIAK